MNEENKDTAKNETNDTAMMGTKIDCRCKSPDSTPLWIAIAVLFVNSCSGCVPSLREHRMEQDIAIHESDIQRLNSKTHSMNKELEVMDEDRARVESSLVYTQLKVNGMEKSLSELVNQHKTRKK